ncbi:nucleoplasmin-like protein isoform X1 [Vanessa tameamea]|uniref:Nucleoplasmin-like protein isoform X1 n=1 Tax=Vanessa tameamea TaxID=334116 RepID=A0A8B8IQM9_VANTA|nr:nucleoplasmin-like protein isoform X1 [Vanessa tameamea]XP_046972976.1 nucleoplasmin-like protein isoform X1 [Vanessa cardui]XP_047539731.1 nucleoplasmin-like protein isoform X1 [Vanessa atalanta]
MSDEYFYGVTLSSSHKSETWDPEAKAEYPRSNKLLIRQALLGPDAEPDELNVVQVETMCLQESIKIPVAILKVGETRQARLDIEFPDAPVTFTLIQGSGPVHLIGQHLLGALVEEFEDMEEMEEEMLDEEEGDDSQFKEDENKRKAPSGKRKTNEDEDDEEGEGPKGKKAKMSNNAKGKAPSPKKNAKK